MKHNPKFIYPKSIRSLIDDKRHYEIGTIKLPSVTTILSATMPEEKRKSLDAWKLRVGNTEAQKVVTTAANRGTALHTILEHYITGQGYLDLTEIGKNAHTMAQTIFEKGLKDKVSEYYAIEATLFYPDLYAGATDMVAVHNGQDSIIDFKQSNKPKRREWIEDYCLQLAGYAMAHNAVHGTSIQKGVVMMVTPDSYYQEFIIEGEELKKYKHEFLERVDKYYNIIKDLTIVDKSNKIDTMKGYNQ
jgi:genome maintenance exonuclease 1